MTPEQEVPRDKGKTTQMVGILSHTLSDYTYQLLKSPTGTVASTGKDASGTGGLTGMFTSFLSPGATNPEPRGLFALRLPEASLRELTAPGRSR
jgi:hypothetical protein